MCCTHSAHLRALLLDRRQNVANQRAQLLVLALHRVRLTQRSAALVWRCACVLEITHLSGQGGGIPARTNRYDADYAVCARTHPSTYQHAQLLVLCARQLGGRRSRFHRRQLCTSAPVVPSQALQTCAEHTPNPKRAAAVPASPRRKRQRANVVSTWPGQARTRSARTVASAEPWPAHACLQHASMARSRARALRAPLPSAHGRQRRVIVERTGQSGGF